MHEALGSSLSTSRKERREDERKGGKKETPTILMFCVVKESKNKHCPNSGRAVRSSEVVIPIAEALYSHLCEHSVSLPVEFRPLSLSSGSAVYQPGLGRFLNWASPGS